MPFTVKKDIQPNFGLDKDAFSLRDMKDFTKGSVVNHVKEKIADVNFIEFRDEWNLNVDLEKIPRNILIALSKHFNLNEREDIFRELWKVSQKSNVYKKSKDKDGKEIKKKIEEDLMLAYERVAKIASGESVDAISFCRKVERSDENFVVFSDLHMTNLSKLPNYFKDFNKELYLKVLDYYSNKSYCLVENGDVEECIIYDVSMEEAEKRAKSVGKFPIVDNLDWKEFLEVRYAKRMETLENVIDSFQDYYKAIKTKFIAKDKYVRLTGNHDTYSDEPFERDLKNRIEDELGMDVADVLTIKRDRHIEYVVLHGHQFDSVSQIHGDIQWAKSFGEIYSENVSWAFQGPDRFWESKDTKKWTVGNTFENWLARETYGKFGEGPNNPNDDTTGLKNALVFNSKNAIKRDSKDFVESLLEHEIAWEYFENDSDDPASGYYATALEVLTGDEMFKFRHMNEINLCVEYERIFKSMRINTGKEIPTLVLGHTHEPRQNALRRDGDVLKPCNHYLNSGSAGRFENLIWCVEIRGDKDYIVSWSFDNDKNLRKTTWKSIKGQLRYSEDDVETIDLRTMIRPIFD
ncbi:MAG: metallophosphoesterase [Flavobacteriales bacterium]|nr:metallophosphoesterase [Flavobacteriales bacterium]